MRTTHLLLAATGGLLATGLANAGGDCQSSAPRSEHVVLSRSHDDIVETAMAAGSFNTLATALQAAGLVDALKGDGPFTVFAPTDAAFARLPQGTVESLLEPENKGLLTAILTYHVVGGKYPADKVTARTTLPTLNGQRIDIAVDGAVRVDAARVTKANIHCSNGVIHVIDRVIMPNSETILETAAEAGSFGTLAAAIKAAGLTRQLSGDGPFTVFAPTDAAFARLPAGTLQTLLRPENKEQLRQILTYHVLPGRIYASDALSAQTARTAEGSRLRFGLNSGGFMVNDASIVEPDVEASNGVIHVIDRVLLPD